MFRLHSLTALLALTACGPLADEDALSLGPDGADTTADLTARLGAAAGADDDVSWTWTWSVDGVVQDDLTAEWVPSDRTARDQVWTVEATPKAGLRTGDPLRATVTIANAPPVVDGITVFADTPKTPAPTSDAPLEVEAGGTDPDGDPITFTYRWTIDDVVVQDVDGPSLPADAFERGDIVRVAATPNDGIADGDPLTSDEIWIRNAAPEVTMSRVLPEAPTRADELRCEAVEVIDADGDPVDLRFTWFVNGEQTGTGPTFDGRFTTRGDAVACTAQPHDGREGGSVVSSETVTIQNAAPYAEAAELGPIDATAGDTLTCSLSGVDDADGDKLATRWAWAVNGTTVEGADQHTLVGAFQRGDEVRCRATLSDGVDTSEVIASAPVTVINSAPTLAAVGLTPDVVTVIDTLSCQPGDAEDIDGDPITYRYRWTVDGSAAPGATESTFSVGLAAKGSEIACFATPHDGIEAGLPVASPPTVVQNAGPTLSSAVLTPTGVRSGDVLTCTANGVGDPDGDPVTLTRTWTVDGNASDTTGETFDLTGLTRGTVVGCSVVASDGELSTDPVSAGTTELLNTAPSITAASVLPEEPTIADTLTCTPSNLTDPDGDEVALAYTWSVNGSVVTGETGSTLEGADLSPGDEVACTLTPDDGLDTGETVVATPEEVIDAAPTLDAAVLSPADPVSGDTVTCVAEGAHDIEGAELSYSYSWTGDGVFLDVSTATYTVPDGSRGSSLSCSIQVSDGVKTSEWVGSEVATVGNAAPTAPTVFIDPAEPTTDDDLVCEIDEEATDADSDAITYSFAFTVDGMEYRGTPVDTMYPGDTVPAEDLEVDDAWTCTATANDGEVDGPASDEAPTVDVTPGFAPMEDVEGRCLSWSGDTCTHAQIRLEADSCADYPNTGAWHDLTDYNGPSNSAELYCGVTTGDTKVSAIRSGGAVALGSLAACAWYSSRHPMCDIRWATAGPPDSWDVSNSSAGFTFYPSYCSKGDLLEITCASPAAP